MKRTLLTLVMTASVWCVSSTSPVMAQETERIDITGFEDGRDWSYEGNSILASGVVDRTAMNGVEPVDGDHALYVAYLNELNPWNWSSMLFPTEPVDLRGATELRMSVYVYPSSIPNPDKGYEITVDLSDNRLGSQTTWTTGQWVELVWSIDRFTTDELVGIEEIGGFICPGYTDMSGEILIDNIYAVKGQAPQVKTQTVYGFNDADPMTGEPTGWMSSLGDPPSLGEGEVTPSEGSNYMVVYLGEGYLWNVETWNAIQDFDKWSDVVEILIDVRHDGLITDWVDLSIVLESGTNEWDTIQDQYDGKMFTYAVDQWKTLLWEVDMSKHANNLNDPDGWLSIVLVTNNSTLDMGLPVYVDNFRVSLPQGSTPAPSGNINTPENFPDPNFRQAVEEFMGVGPGGAFTAAEAAAKKDWLYCDELGITSMKGIEFFTNIGALHCSGNLITQLDLSNNTELTELRCGMNNLTGLNLSNNPKLELLICAHNNLTSLNVSNNERLESLTCNGNNLTTLDLSRNPSLTYLHCRNNVLTNLDLSNNPFLTELYCGMNNLTNLDMSNNPELAILYCETNNLTDLNVSSCPKLSDLYCNENNLTTLDVSNNQVLDSLTCSENDLETLDVAGNTALAQLSCHGNWLKTLNLGNKPVLADLSCSDNHLTSLNLSGCTALTTLYCNGNRLTSLDISSNAALVTAHANENDLTTVSVSGQNTSLLEFRCWANSLKTLDVTGATNLEFLGCGGNELTNLNVSTNTALKTLKCSLNNLTDLTSLVANTGLGTGDMVDVRWNDLDCDDWNDVMTLLNRIGEPVPDPSDPSQLISGFGYSPQNTMDPYDCSGQVPTNTPTTAATNTPTNTPTTRATSTPTNTPRPTPTFTPQPGRISGIITRGGMVLSGATVFIGSYNTTTNATGFFQFEEAIPPGQYPIRVIYNQIQEYSDTITVTAGESRILDLQMPTFTPTSTPTHTPTPTPTEALAATNTPTPTLTPSPTESKPDTVSLILKILNEDTFAPVVDALVLVQDPPTFGNTDDKGNVILDVPAGTVHLIITQDEYKRYEEDIVVTAGMAPRTILLTPSTSAATLTPTPKPIATPTPTATAKTEGNLTLVVISRSRLEKRYGAEKVRTFMAKLERLLQHDTVRGEIVDLDLNPSLRNLYQEWDASTRKLESATDADRNENVLKANMVSTAIKTITGNQRDRIRNESVEYLLLVGCDDIVPHYRLPDLSRSKFGEKNYEDRLLDPTHPLGAALSTNHILIDDYYADATPKSVAILGRDFYLPDLKIGRLVETPEEMGAVIDSYLALDGKIHFDRAFVAGSDSLSNGADRSKQILESDLGEVERLSEDSADPIEIADALNKKNAVNVLGLHGNHTEIFRKGNTAPLTSERVSQFVKDVSGSVIVNLGSHAGLSTDSDYSDGKKALAGTFAKKGAIAYIGSTAYSGASKSSVGFSEDLSNRFVHSLVSGKETATVGEALRAAKRKYVINEHNGIKNSNLSDDEIKRNVGEDEKVVSGMNLYGLPMYKVTSSNAAADPHLALGYGDEDCGLLPNREKSTVDYVRSPLTPALSHEEREKNSPEQKGHSVWLCHSDNRLQADTEKVHTEMAHTKTADAEMTATKMADTEKARTKTADTKMTDTKTADAEKARTKTADTKMTGTKSDPLPIDSPLSPWERDRVRVLHAKPKQAGDNLLQSERIEIIKETFLEKHETETGTFYAFNGITQANVNEPVQPRAGYLTGTEGFFPKGAVLEYAKYRVIDAFDPVIEGGQWGAAGAAEGDFTKDGFFPAIPFTVNIIEAQGGLPPLQRFVFVAGQYNRNTGEERLYQELRYSTYYTATETDETPPVVGDPSTVVSGDRVLVNVEASDLEGKPLYRVLLLWTDGEGEWNKLDLDQSPSNPLVWEGTLQKEEGLEFFVQAVDQWGNVAYADNRGRYYRPLEGGGPEPTPLPANVLVSVGFNQASIEEVGMVHAPAQGFDPASIQLGTVPSGQDTDGRGLIFDANPGEGTLAISTSSLPVGEGAVLLEVQAYAENPGCSVALAALNSPIDGQLGYTNAGNSDVPVGKWAKLVLLYDPPANSLQPGLQVVLPDGAANATKVYFDNLVVSRVSDLQFQDVTMDVDGSFDEGTAGLMQNVNQDTGTVEALREISGGKSIILSLAETDNAANIGVFAGSLQGGFPHILSASVDARLLTGSGGVTALVMTNGNGNVGVFVSNAGLPPATESAKTISIGGGFVSENPAFPLLSVIQNGGPGVTSEVVVDNLKLRKITAGL